HPTSLKPSPIASDRVRAENRWSRTSVIVGEHRPAERKKYPDGSRNAPDGGGYPKRVSAFPAASSEASQPPAGTKPKKRPPEGGLFMELPDDVLLSQASCLLSAALRCFTVLFGMGR